MTKSERRLYQRVDAACGLRGWWLGIEPDAEDDSVFVITASRPGRAEETIGAGQGLKAALRHAEQNLDLLHP
jgi:hypothetical protein